MLENLVLTAMCLCLGVVVFGVAFAILKGVAGIFQPKSKTPYVLTKEDAEDFQRTEETREWAREQWEKEREEEETRKYNEEWDRQHGK